MNTKSTVTAQNPFSLDQLTLFQAQCTRAHFHYKRKGQSRYGLHGGTHPMLGNWSAYVLLLPPQPRPTKSTSPFPESSHA